MSKGLASVAIAVMILGGAIAMFVNLTGTPTLKPAVPLSPNAAPIREFDVVGGYPHDPRALTQGLVYTGGFLYESIGLQGQSSIRKVGDVVTSHPEEAMAILRTWLHQPV